MDWKKLIWGQFVSQHSLRMTKYANLKGRYGRVLRSTRALTTARCAPSASSSAPVRVCTMPSSLAPKDWKPLALPLPAPVLSFPYFPLPPLVPSPPRLPPTVAQIEAAHRRQLIATMKG
jgi:hypothetical protein